MRREQISSDLIRDPRLWRLSMELQADALEVVLFCTLEEQSLIHRRVEFDKAAPSQLKAFEDTVYDNPLLLADFARVDLLVDTRHYMVIPGEIKSDEVKKRMLDTMWPDADLEPVTNPLPMGDTSLLIGVEKPLLSFIRRSYPNVKVTHPLTSLISYFYCKDRFVNSDRIYAHLHPDAVDIIYLRDGRVHVANTFDVSGTDDMLYYIMAVSKEAGFSLESDEIMLCGAPKVRETLAPMLRRYASYVMPVVFPSAMYHAGRDAIESPFELILLPLCV